MNIGLRNKVRKIPWLHSICVSAVDILNAAFYMKHKKRTAESISNLKSVGKKDRCFIVGNGPSLTISDLELIKDEDCFAANLIYRIFDKTEWRPLYYIVQDRYADVGDTLNTMDIKNMFIGDYFWRKRGMNNPSAMCIRTKRIDARKKCLFSENIVDYVVNTSTVTYSMLQIAIYLGYKEIYLLGIDHNYEFTCDDKGRIIRNENVRSHFFEDKNPKEVIADIESMNISYIRARDYAEEHGVRIINVTRGGRLDWYPRAKLEEVLEIE